MERGIEEIPVQVVSEAMTTAVVTVAPDVSVEAARRRGEEA